MVVLMDTETCNTCGYEYGIDKQIEESNGGLYWTPSCPRCGADIGPEPEPADIGIMLEVASESPHDAQYLIERAMLAAKHIHSEDINQ